MSIESSPRAVSLAKRFRKLIRGTAVGMAVCLSISGWSGCSRQNYRYKTDTEAYYLLDEKRSQSCESNAASIRIELDPRSRMFDPFNPDRPPMPEDDPQANRFMRCVDHKQGYPLWEGNGRTNMAENPEWWNYLPLDERGVLVLNLEEAVRLALLHSPTYQSNLEEMYLSALDVSVERFLLDSQFFGGRGISYAHAGPLAGGSSSLVRGDNTSLSMRKALAAGGTIAVDFANTLTWQLAGPDTFVSPSSLNFSFIQPLLRRGGRDFALERLTLAERVLLSNVRAFERYRRGFYVQIATGAGPDTSPRRRGGAFGGAGLGGFDVLGSVFSGAGGGGGFGGGGAVPGAGGYLGLLQDQLAIENQKDTIIRLQDLYLQLQDNYRELLLTMPDNQTEIPSQQIQVAQAQQSVYDAQTRLLGDVSGYEATLDSFKATLGLPPYLCVEIEGNLLDQFKLISQELRERRTIIANFRMAVGNRNTELLNLTEVTRDPETAESSRILSSSPQLATALGALKDQMNPIGDIFDLISNEDVSQVRQDIERLRQNIPVRRQQLNRLKDIATREAEMVCSLLPLGKVNTTFLDGAGLEELPDELTDDLNRIVGQLEELRENYDAFLEATDTAVDEMDSFADDEQRFAAISEKVVLASQDLIASLNEKVIAIQVVQARARTESVLLPEINLEPRDALEVARRNRRDWLNARASLVDTWRQIEVVADDLESVLDFTFNAGIGNGSSANPFALKADATTSTVGLRWDAPITRVQERNNYRQILISYQRAKRSYYQFEDSIWGSMRATLRQVRQNQLSFEIQRFAVQNAALQISINEDIRQINETLGQVSGPTAARDAVQGLQAFLNTQSQLIGIFVNYEALRRNLDLDLGTMEVDATGLWIDPGPLTLDTIGGDYRRVLRQAGSVEMGSPASDEIQIAPLPYGNTTPEVVPQPLPGETLMMAPEQQGSEPLIQQPVPPTTPSYASNVRALPTPGARSLTGPQNRVQIGNYPAPGNSNVQWASSSSLPYPE